MTHDVFISYSDKDRLTVSAICAYLEQNEIRCFVAYRDIPKGVVWAGAITEAIERCSIMLIIYSGNFNESEQVDREIELCSNRKKPILTFKLSSAPYNKVKQYYLQNINWIDAFPDPGKYFNQLKISITKLLNDGFGEGIDNTQKAQSLQSENIAKPKDFDKIWKSANDLFIEGLNEDNISKIDESNDLFSSCASLGHAPSQFVIGMMYLSGIKDGIKFNPRAIEYLSKSASQDYLDACFVLALIYASNIMGGKFDAIEAKRWYDRSRVLSDEDILELYGKDAKMAVDGILNTFSMSDEEEQQQNIEKESASLLIRFGKRFVLIDNKLKIYIDDILLGPGSFRNGFSFNATVLTGHHLLKVSGFMIEDILPFKIDKSGKYLIVLKYSTYPTIEFKIESFEFIG